MIFQSGTVGHLWRGKVPPASLLRRLCNIMQCMILFTTNASNLTDSIGSVVCQLWIKRMIIKIQLRKKIYRLYYIPDRKELKSLVARICEWPRNRTSSSLLPSFMTISEVKYYITNSTPKVTARNMQITLVRWHIILCFNLFCIFLIFASFNLTS